MVISSVGEATLKACQAKSYFHLSRLGYSQAQKRTNRLSIMNQTLQCYMCVKEDRLGECV